PGHARDRGGVLRRHGGVLRLPHALRRLRDRRGHDRRDLPGAHPQRLLHELVQRAGEGPRLRVQPGLPGDGRVAHADRRGAALERASGKAAPFSGPRGIEAVLRGLAERYGWEPKEEDGRVVALAREGASITLEPGAQLELSGEQCPTIHCTQAELATHVREVVSVGGELGIAFL